MPANFFWIVSSSYGGRVEALFFSEGRDRCKGGTAEKWSRTGVRSEAGSEQVGRVFLFRPNVFSVFLWFPHLTFWPIFHCVPTLHDCKFTSSHPKNLSGPFFRNNLTRLEIISEVKITLKGYFFKNLALWSCGGGTELRKPLNPGNTKNYPPKKIPHPKLAPENTKKIPTNTNMVVWKGIFRAL